MENTPTYHLNENTTDNDDRKDIGTHMGQLIIPRKGEFERDSKALLMSISFRY